MSLGMNRTRVLIHRQIERYAIDNECLFYLREQDVAIDGGFNDATSSP